MFQGHRRFITPASDQFRKLKGAACLYPTLLSENEAIGLWQKPLDWRKGHPTFVFGLTQLLNGISAMDLDANSTIVEVGSGAGWVTELLAGLSYRVVCLEPSEAMIEVAKGRISSFLNAHRMPELYANVTWHCTTMEEVNLDDESVDAILFYESFHHLIDEERAVANAYRILRNQGKLCILGDSNWIPGNEEQEGFWRQEMEKFGALESPFTHEYLTHLLESAGFSEVTRYHTVNTLVPIDRDNEPVRSFVTLNAAYVNLFTARKLHSTHKLMDGEQRRLDNSCLSTSPPTIASETAEGYEIEAQAPAEQHADRAGTRVTRFNERIPS